MTHVDVPDIPRQSELGLPADATALIVVDMQNDFVDEAGALHVPDAAATVPRIHELADRALEAGARLVYTQDWHTEDDREFDVWPRHAVMETWGARIVDGLEPDRADRVIRKLRYDAFYGTPLDHTLRDWGTEHVVVVGTVANICVLHTAASAALRWYDVTLVEDAVSALTPFDLDASLRQLDFLYGGRIVQSADLRLDPAQPR